MAVIVMVQCDFSWPDGGACGGNRKVETKDVARAIQAALAHGWSWDRVGGFRCPAHVGR